MHYLLSTYLILNLALKFQSCLLFNLDYLLKAPFMGNSIMSNKIAVSTAIATGVLGLGFWYLYRKSGSTKSLKARMIKINTNSQSQFLHK